jgi:hypothetical protein
MNRGRTAIATTLGCAMALALPPAAGAASDGPGAEEPRKARVGVEVRGLDGSRARVGKRVTVVGKVRPFVRGDRLEVVLMRGGKVVERRRSKVRPVPGKKNVGRVRLRSKRLEKHGSYKGRATHKRSRRLGPDRDSTRSFRLSFPDLRYGDRGTAVRVFHKLLRRAGYGNAPGGREFKSASGRAVHAFRKVNGMSRSERATSRVFRTLAAGKGGFKLRYPGAGKHVEVDLSRQVMVLAKGRRPRYTYHISSGAPSTPSAQGKFHFYSKDPGYNSIGMYYSVYYNGGEATHGYQSVPDYPASHGCIRNPVPDSVFIYNWIDLGDPIWVYD